jgi:hypothetical protein
MYCRSKHRSLWYVGYVLCILALCFSLSYSWKYVSRNAASRGPFHSGKNRSTAPLPRSPPPPHTANPEFSTWNLFAAHKVVFVAIESSDVRTLPCIQPPNGTATPKLHWDRVCLLYVMRPNHAPSSSEVSAVLHFTRERFSHAEHTCSRWGGPVVAVLYVRSEELPLLASLVDAAKGFQRRHELCMMHLELYVAVDVRPGGGSYPINFLRNVGLYAAATPRVVAIDADFIPSSNAAAALSKLPAPPNGSPTAYVLPVFQFDGHGHLLALPHDKEELLAMLMLGLAAPMLQDHPAQHFTNYAAWAIATVPYVVTYGAFYEPYVMLSRGRHNPLFSELFLSMGNDKCSLHFELHAARYQYIVHSDHFLFHIPHATGGNWRNPGNFIDLAWTNLKLFMSYLQSKYHYDLPRDPNADEGRVMSGTWVLAPPVSIWLPPPLRMNPPLAIATAFEHGFFFNAESLNVQIPPALLAENALKMNKTNPCGISNECFIVGPVGWSCSSACAALGRSCDVTRIAFYNNCEIVTQKAVCPKGCFIDQGRDLPAIPQWGPQEMQCLVNKVAPICNGRHYMTRRLCACAGRGS